MIPQDADLIRELQYYRFERTSAGNVRLGAPNRVGMYDDLVTALALATYQAGYVDDGCYVPDLGLLDDEIAFSHRLETGQYTVWDILRLTGQMPHIPNNNY